MIIPDQPNTRARVHIPNEAGGFTFFICYVVAWRIDEQADPVFSRPVKKGSYIEYQDPVFGDGYFETQTKAAQVQDNGKSTLRI